MIELKSCPKCGASPVFVTHKDLPIGLTCSNKDCIWSYFCISYGNKEKAMNDWNKIVMVNKRSN